VQDEWRRRSLFREVNERIRGIHVEFSVASDRLEVLCECGRADCLRRVEVPARVYETVRTTPGYLVSRGHELPESDAVETDDGHWFVIAPRPAT